MTSADRSYTPAAIARLLALDVEKIEDWIADGRLAASRGPGVYAVTREQLEQFWEDPPKVRYASAPLDLRGELAHYAGESKARRDEAQELCSLLRFLGARDLESLWQASTDQIRAWRERPKRPWRGRAGRRRGDPLGEFRRVRAIVAALAARRGLAVPAALVELCARRDGRGGGPARTGWPAWIGHPWESDLRACAAGIRGTPKGVKVRVECLLQLSSHLVEHVEPGTSLGAALVDRAVLIAAFQDLESASRKQRGRWSASTMNHLLEVCRAVIGAASIGGGLSTPTRAALIGKFNNGRPLEAVQMPLVAQQYIAWARAELRHAGIKPDPRKPVLPPSDEEVRERLSSLAERIGIARAEHAAAGLDLDDFRRWREWSRELRDLLGDAVAAHLLIAAGLRGGSLHGIQVNGITPDDTYPGAVAIDRIIVKYVAREGADGITTQHGNEAYDPALARGVDCSTWIALPVEAFPVTLRQALEWYLHACGQCLGPRNGCASSTEPVIRWVELEFTDRWEYRQVGDLHIAGRMSHVSKDGEWLSGLQAIRGTTVRFAPLWWSSDGLDPLLQRGLTDRLTLVFGPKLHRWRHYSLFYLTTKYPISLDRAALMIHMDPKTAERIYNNPSIKQILASLKDEVARRSSDGREEKLAAARSELGAAKARVHELEHWLQYLATVYAVLPKPPTAPTAFLPPIAATKPKRSRARPRGGDAFAA